MSLKEQLLNDMKTAMKEKDTVRKNAVQMTRSAVLQTEKDKQTELDDSGVTEIIAKEVKKRKDSLADYQKSGRENLINDLQREIEVLSAYLPEPLTEAELEPIVQQAINEAGAESMKDMGKVMGIVKPQVTGRADGRMISEIVKRLLT